MSPAAPTLTPGLPGRTSQALSALFPERLRLGVRLARYTAARLGGPAEALLAVESAEELAQAASLLWAHEQPFVVLGGGSNVLVSEAGVRGVVLLNRARKVRFAADSQPPAVWCESGANLGVVARQAAGQGLSGLEWAAGIPGTVGGAVVGNAGAHGGDTAGNLSVAEILHPDGMRRQYSAADLDYAYRSSLLKRTPGQFLVLSARLNLEPKAMTEIEATMERFLEHRRRTQPPGASLGSMFKNPPGDYAGRLIEAAGLKGYQVGGAQISPVHANFFINTGDGSAADIYALIQVARAAVQEKFGIMLELEIELLGEWN